MQEAKTQEVETTAQREVCPNFAGYLSAILLEMGILKNSSSDGDMQMIEDCSSILIDTEDGEHVQLELLQVEDSVPEKMVVLYCSWGLKLLSTQIHDLDKCKIKYIIS